MAASHTRNDQVFAQGGEYRREPDRKARKSALVVMLAAGALLVMAPVAVTAFVADRSEPASQPAQSDAALVAFAGSAVELDGAIMNFSQQGNAVNLSLMATDDGQRVFVQDAAGELFEIAVSPGHTNVSAELPAHFAASETLTFRVD